MNELQMLTEIVLRNSPLAWWEWDVIHNVVISNDLKCTMLGYHPDTFKGQGFEAYTSLVHPDDFEKTMDAMRKILRGEKDIYQIDYRIRDSSDQYHWYMDRGVVLSKENGVISRLRGIVIDLGMENNGGTNTNALVELLNSYSENQNNMITICSSCKRVKVSMEEWTPITYELRNSISDTISHGICPDCIDALYPDLAEKIRRR